MLIQDHGIDHSRHALSTLAAAREQWRLVCMTQAGTSSSSAWALPRSKALADLVC